MKKYLKIFTSVIMALALVTGIFIFNDINNNGKKEQTSTITINDEDTPLATVGGEDNKSVKNLTSSQRAVIANELTRLANTQRSKKVSVKSKLKASSKVRSGEIKKRWSHTRPNGKSWVTALKAQGINTNRIYKGENLARATIKGDSSYTTSQLKSVAKQIHKSFMASASHKKVIKNKVYKKVGVNVTTCANSNGTVSIYVAEHFTSK